MSIKLMTAVWAREDLTSTQKLVLLALADWSNDEGLSWPSIDQLMKKSSLKKRAVQITMRSLEEAGFVRRDEVLGKGNKYWITLPVHNMHPCTECTTPAHQMHPTPASNAPNTSRIHQLTINNNISLKPAGVSDQVWKDFLEVRKAKKAPLTATGLTRMANEAAKAGWTLEEAIAESVSRGWQSFKAEWVKDKSNGKERNQYGRGKAKDGVNAALDDLLGLGEPTRTPRRSNGDCLAEGGQLAITGPRTMR